MAQADIVKILNIRLGPAIKIYSSILLLRGTNIADSNGAHETATCDRNLHRDSSNVRHKNL